MPLVEIWSDVVCPWCAIGRARFQRALAAHDGPAPDVRYRSYELDRNAPAEVEGDHVAGLARKYRVPQEQAQAMVDRVVALGAEEGIAFRYDLVRPGNTFDAHRVLHLAHAQGIQEQVKSAFLRGYHTEGAAIGRHEELVRLATAAGLEGAAVEAVLAGDAYAADVRDDEEQAFDLGIGGVPFFVFDRRFGVSGAQPVEVLSQALDRLAEAA